MKQILESLILGGVSGFDCIWFSNMPKQENTILQIFHELVNSSCVHVPSPPPLCERFNEHRRPVDRPTPTSRPTAVSEHFLSDDHTPNDMELIPLEPQASQAHV